MKGDVEGETQKDERRDSPGFNKRCINALAPREIERARKVFFSFFFLSFFLCSHFVACREREKESAGRGIGAKREK